MDLLSEDKFTYFSRKSQQNIFDKYPMMAARTFTRIASKLRYFAPLSTLPTVTGLFLYNLCIHL